MKYTNHTKKYMKDKQRLMLNYMVNTSVATTQVKKQTTLKTLEGLSTYLFPRGKCGNPECYDNHFSAFLYSFTAFIYIISRQVFLSFSFFHYPPKQPFRIFSPYHSPMKF